MPNDILLDDNYDIRIENGDLVVGESTRQHQKLILLAEKGENREFPTHGVGLASWLNDDLQFGDLRSAVKREFERDGMRVLGIKGSGFDLNVDAAYE